MKKISFDTKKTAETAKGLFSKATDAGKKAVEDVQQGAKALSDKAKSDSYMRRIKKYNPLFPEQYKNSDFNIPNMIMIRDDAERKGIDVCEGAIGWLNNDSEMEVLCLYDEAIEMSGIKFLPAPVCDAVYYIDSFDRNCFIRTDYIFQKAHEERLAELKNIAYMLGAKACSIEISETIHETVIDKKKMDFSAKIPINTSLKASGKAEQNYSFQDTNKRSGKITAKFEGNDSPKRPELKWFANDENIKNLIEMRCSQGNSIQSETLELSGSTSATMAQKTAYAIDCAMTKIGAKGSSSMEHQAVKENTSTLIFRIKF